MNLKFMELKYDEITAVNKLDGWVVSHWVRIAIAIFSGVYAVKGLQKLSR